MQPTLNLKRNRPPHWSINKLITANDRIGDICCRIETITGHQFSAQWKFTNLYNQRRRAGELKNAIIFK